MFGTRRRLFTIPLSAQRTTLTSQSRKGIARRNRSQNITSGTICRSRSCFLKMPEFYTGVYIYNFQRPVSASQRKYQRAKINSLRVTAGDSVLRQGIGKPRASKIKFCEWTVQKYIGFCIAGYRKWLPTAIFLVNKGSR